MAVRRLAHAMGYRYRLHGKNLPGKPDLVFSSRRKVIFVHGCFWHQHRGCKAAHVPRSNLDYWLPKLARNKARDTRSKRELRRMGWDWLVVWECETPDTKALVKRLRGFLNR